VPTDVTTSWPSTDAMTTRYDAPKWFASENTSAGPATSSNFIEQIFRAAGRRGVDGAGRSADL